MNNNDFLNELIETIKVKKVYNNKNVIESYADKLSFWKESVLKSNIRKWDDDLINLENKFLKSLLTKRGICNCYELNEEYQLSDKIFVWCGDEAAICIDAIAIPVTFELNDSENNYLYDLYYYNGVKLRLKCLDAMNDTKLESSELVITRSYNILSDFIIHVNYSYDDLECFKKSILNIMNCCRINMIKTIMLCFDKEDMVYYKIALDVVRDYLNKFGVFFDKVIFKANKEILIEDLDNIEL